MNIVIKLFLNDLEDALRLNNGFSISIDENKKLNKNFEFVESYLNDKFNIYIDSKKLKIVYSNKNIINDILQLKATLQIKEKIFSIRIINQILLDVYDNQSNVLFIKNLKKKQFFKFDKTNQDKLFIY
tara:strand:- start:30 stop:413 length:384 start_codon:yes stop_codon:yes gene_type:complete